MVQVYNYIDKVAGDPDQGVAITIEMKWDKDQFPFPKHDNDRTIISPHFTRTNADGHWVVELVSNALITPDNLYKVTEHFSPRDERTVYYIDVPDDLGPGLHWVGDLVVPEDSLPSWVG